MPNTHLPDREKMKPSDLSFLREIYGSRLQENTLLAGYTSTRVGGPADASIMVRSADELSEIVMRMWEKAIPFILIGAGSNLLVSDKGMRELLVINRARSVRFIGTGESPIAQAESGTTVNDLTQKAALLGMSGLEWAATIPGSLGGAIYGNAGAFNGDMAGNLISVDLLHRQLGRQTWPVEKMEYAYRSSILKREHLQIAILSAELALKKSTPEAVRQLMEQNSLRRRSSQPLGASMGSIFKNPPGDHAGRLIEQAGLKGTKIGNAEISPLHANFIINHGQTSARDVRELIDIARQEVEKQFGVELELEIELVGEW
jgi:UDP-N-acetylmuramate dehydrogenase